MRILIDPGHGGLQLGDAGPAGALEKHLTLRLAQELARQAAGTPLEPKLLFTRADDSDVTHRQRQAMASHADLGVSLHFHSANNPYLHRVEGGARLAEGEALARLLIQNVALATGETFVYRPIQCRFTSGARKAICVLMLGYLSHPETERQLVEGDRLEATARALLRGLEACVSGRAGNA